MLEYADSVALLANKAYDAASLIDNHAGFAKGRYGRPVWVGFKWLPDWGWMLDRSDSPWYPTVKLYRQPQRGDWDSVFRQITSDLEQCASALFQYDAWASTGADD